MKLEFKNIAPYLPYDLKFRLESGKEDDLKDHYFIYSISPIKNWVVLSNLKYDTKVFIPQLKPLLHPLSRLTEPILEGGKTPEQWFKEQDSFGDFFQQYSEMEENIATIPFRCGLKLFEWHFDVFGLIEKGLAEPIETSKAKGG